MSKKKRGGRREGAGRPMIGEDPRVAMCLSLPPNLAERLREQAALEGISASELVERMLADGFEPKTSTMPDSCGYNPKTGSY